MKSICFTCCRKGSTWQNRVPKARPHPIISLTFLSHPHPTVIYLLEFKVMFAFFWSLHSFFFWVIFLNSCQKSVAVKTNHNYYFLSLAISSAASEYWKNACLRSVIQRFFSVMQGFPGWTGKEFSYKKEESSFKKTSFSYSLLKRFRLMSSLKEKYLFIGIKFKMPKVIGEWWCLTH